MADTKYEYECDGASGCQKMLSHLSIVTIFVYGAVTSTLEVSVLRGCSRPEIQIQWGWMHFSGGKQYKHVRILLAKVETNARR